MFLLIISLLSITDINSYAGLDDLIVLGVGCLMDGFWETMLAVEHVRLLELIVGL